MENKDTGLLLNKHDIELHRLWFKQMTKLIGINVLHRSPKATTKQYDLHGELDTLYEPPVLVGCIFQEHVDQKTSKKLGWNAELDESLAVIHVPYDLAGLQKGSLFIIPTGVDSGQARVFRVVEMSTIAIYPATIACQIGPVYQNEFEKSSLEDWKSNNFNLLNEEEED